MTPNDKLSPQEEMKCATDGKFVIKSKRLYIFFIIWKAKDSIKQ